MTMDLGIQGSSTSTFGSNRLKPTVDGHSWGCHLALPRISDVEGLGWPSADSMWRQATPLGGPWPSYPLGLLLEGLLLLNLAVFYPTSTILQVQVEPNEI